MEFEPNGDEFHASWPESARKAEHPMEDDEEDDPAEDDSTAEPSLGSLDQHDNQERWAAGNRRDLEQDPADSGIGDFDGLLEQVGTQDYQQGALA